MQSFYQQIYQVSKNCILLINDKKLLIYYLKLCKTFLNIPRTCNVCHRMQSLRLLSDFTETNCLPATAYDVVVCHASLLNIMYSVTFAYVCVCVCVCVCVHARVNAT